MKFVALALTIILAAGSQARSLQSDAPDLSNWDHLKAGGETYMHQAIEKAKKLLDELDDKEFKDSKVKLSQSLDDFEAKVKSLSEKVSPYIQTAYTQVMEATKEMREKLRDDFAKLKEEVTPKYDELKTVLRTHMTQYYEKLEPPVTEYMAQQKKDLEELKTKIQGMHDELQKKIQTNVEETKSKLMPIVEAIRTKMTERLEELKLVATPYVEEFKEQLPKNAAETGEKLTTQVGELREKLEPFIEELKTKIMELSQTISTQKS